ncbi:MAG: DUF2807 domain-containing protein [Gammaproteobacteria bacterium]|nr:DUF2807 domain-containing protein [Gammaproteobacteria bacterium]
MKILGMMLVFILTLAQNVCAQPLEYKDEPSFCQRVTKYIYQRPDLTVRNTPIRIRTRSDHPIAPRIKLTRNLPFIDAVFIRGGVDLQIIGTPGCNKISVKTAYPGLGVKVCDGAIYISNTKPVDCNQNPKPCIKLCINELRHLVVAGTSCSAGGNSCITVNNIHSPCGLEVESCGSGLICINGPVNLVRVMNNGTATICVNHIQSDHLHVLGTKYGVVRLSGSADLLLIRSFQHATVDARFVCSHTALVQAADESFVTVRSVGSLQAFASGMSNVYYYAKPGELIQHNVLSGNVFPMGGW